jgi:hypothetical protein
MLASLSSMQLESHQTLLGNLEGSVRRVVARIACTTVVGAS